jgi:hypothetical protein
MRPAVQKTSPDDPLMLNRTMSEEDDLVFIFEQYIPVVFINNHKYNCIRGYIV